ncbi:MAG: Putative lyase, partial [uncultured Corynebacteriales bacterium]
ELDPGSGVRAGHRRRALQGVLRRAARVHGRPRHDHRPGEPDRAAHAARLGLLRGDRRRGGRHAGRDAARPATGGQRRPGRPGRAGRPRGRGDRGPGPRARRGPARHGRRRPEQRRLRVLRRPGRQRLGRAADHRPTL